VAAHETQGRKSIHAGNGDYSMMILNKPNGSRRMKKKGNGIDLNIAFSLL